MIQIIKEFILIYIFLNNNKIYKYFQYISQYWFKNQINNSYNNNNNNENKIIFSIILILNKFQFNKFSDIIKNWFLYIINNW